MERCRLELRLNYLKSLREQTLLSSPQCPATRQQMERLLPRHVRTHQALLLCCLAPVDFYCCACCASSVPVKSIWLLSLVLMGKPAMTPFEIGEAGARQP